MGEEQNHLQLLSCCLPIVTLQRSLHLRPSELCTKGQIENVKYGKLSNKYWGLNTFTTSKKKFKLPTQEVRKHWKGIYVDEVNILKFLSLKSGMKIMPGIERAYTSFFFFFFSFVVSSYTQTPWGTGRVSLRLGQGIIKLTPQGWRVLVWPCKLDPFHTPDLMSLRVGCAPSTIIDRA